jgi:ubiquinone/menaquinone biosynthesis C-methylase UbiE
MSRVVDALSVGPLRALLRGRAPKIVGAIDEPGPHQPYARWLDVEGWALAIDGRPVDIIIDADGQTVCPSVPRIARPDVHALFPKVRHAATCGFRIRLESERLPDRAVVELVVKAAVHGRPELNQIIGTSLIERHANLEAGFTRTAYGQVWDSASQSLTDARISVCGTSDDAEWQRSGEATASDVRSEAAVQTSDTVLEIGCGAGRVGRHLAPHCATWIGADVSSNMLRFAAESLKDLPNVRFFKLNGFDLTGVDADSVDVVYSTGVFMHLDEWERYRYIADAHRALRPGGRIYVDNFNLLSDEGWRLFGDLVKVDPSKRPVSVSRHSTPQELETYLVRAGFTDVRVRTGGLWVTALARR